MYAVVESGGRQLKVREGDTVLVDDLRLTPGEGFVFDRVLFYSDEAGDVRVGTPLVDSVTVSGTVAGAALGPKLTVFKFRRRKSSQCKTGHRQKYGQVRIKSIQAGPPAVAADTLNNQATQQPDDPETEPLSN